MHSFPPLSADDPTGDKQDDKNTVRNHPHRNGEPECSRRPPCRSSRFSLQAVKAPTHFLHAKTVTDVRKHVLMSRSGKIGLHFDDDPWRVLGRYNGYGSADTSRSKTLSRSGSGLSLFQFMHQSPENEKDTHPHAKNHELPSVR